MKTMEDAGLLHTQEVRGSSPCAPTILLFCFHKSHPSRTSLQSLNWSKSVPKVGQFGPGGPKVRPCPLVLLYYRFATDC